MAGKVTLNITDTNLNDKTKNLPNVNPALIPEYGLNKSEDIASDIKIACISLMGLTTDTISQIKVISESDITNVPIESGENNG